jgi:hypothetical protein
VGRNNATNNKKKKKEKTEEEEHDYKKLCGFSLVVLFCWLVGFDVFLRQHDVMDRQTWRKRKRGKNWEKLAEIEGRIAFVVIRHWV